MNEQKDLCLMCRIFQDGRLFFFFFFKGNCIFRLWYSLHCFAWWLWLLGRRRQQVGSAGLGRWRGFLWDSIGCYGLQAWATQCSLVLMVTVHISRCCPDLCPVCPESHDLCAAQNFLNVFWMQRAVSIRWHPPWSLMSIWMKSHLILFNLLVQGPFSFLFLCYKKSL